MLPQTWSLEKSTYYLVICDASHHTFCSGVLQAVPEVLRFPFQLAESQFLAAAGRSLDPRYATLSWAPLGMVASSKASQELSEGRLLGPRPTMFYY